MLSPFITKRELSRAWQILTIIGRFGLAPLVQVSGVGRIVGMRLWRRMERRFMQTTPPVRLRLAFVALGTTFIKLGQVLSARSDFLPEEYLHELTSLQDEVPPLPFSDMEPVFRKAFDISPFDAFARFDPTPIASASIGQVYRATLHDGTEVVVKIQRPGVQAQIETDLLLLSRVAGLLQHNPLMARFDLPALVREFSAILQDELIYTLEAYNAETLAAEMADNPKVILPKVFWNYTARQVLTISHMSGIKISDLHALDEAGIDRHTVAQVLANSLLEQILVHGLFHGDPHPGNLLITADGAVIFLDTGMVGRLDRKMRELLVELSVAIFDQDIDAVLSHLQQIGVVTEFASLLALRRDLSRLITKYYFLPRKELRLGELLQRLNSLLFAHHIRMSYEFGLIAKALFLAEGAAQKLDPNFDYNRAARPVIEALRLRYYSSEKFWEDARREWRSLRLQIVDLPSRFSRALEHLERGAFQVRITDEHPEVKRDAENSRANRLTLAIVVVGLAIAVALILSGNPLPWMHYVALATFALDILLAIILAISVLRSGGV